jgi:predicted ATPase/class 3 adenylate cyclase
VRAELPSGTVTFLFTDVEGSTRILHELGAEAYAEALAEHRRVIREACAAKGGVEVDTQGDAFFFAFSTAPGALAAAFAFTAALSSSGPISVRVGLHTGTPLLTDEGYVGDDVHLGARIAACAHGGQVVVSAATAAHAEDSLTDLGEHRLKDIEQAVSIYQLGEESFPPLKTIANTNLPHPASSFLGREVELAEVLARIEEGARLLTLTGPGGTGKTRLAVESASTLVPTYQAGVFWVELATLRDPALVTESISQTLGAKDGLAEHIGEREMLLVLDNLEQVIEAAPVLASLLERCPNLTLLCTSRELLRLRGEVEYPVPPLAAPEAVSLFCERAGLEPTEDIAELCARLDLLPLAVELAAARAKALTPAQIVERLNDRLDLLKGGRDADPRQQTLRATIEWSHDLLSPSEQELFARLSVFVGGCALEAAEEVAGADVDTLQSLVEKSLLRFDSAGSSGRYWLLETIHELAREHVEASGEADELRRRHSHYYRDLAVQLDRRIRAGDPEEGPVSVLTKEIANVRAAVEHALEAGEPLLVREITASLPMYWTVRGHYGEARAWLERALALDGGEDDVRRRLLSALGTIAYAQGDFTVALAASDEAARLAAQLGGATDRIELLKEQAFAAMNKGDLEEAEGLLLERLVTAIDVDNGVATSSCRLNLAYIAGKTGRPARADELLAENLPFVRSRGQVRCEAHTLANMAERRVHTGVTRDAVDEALLAATRALQIDDTPLAVYCLDLFAASAAARGDAHLAAIVLGATERARAAMEVEPDEDEREIRAMALSAIPEDADFVERACAEGRAIELDRALDLARASID